MSREEIGGRQSGGQGTKAEISEPGNTGSGAVEPAIEEEDTFLAPQDAELLRVLAESSRSRYVVEVQAMHLAGTVNSEPASESTLVLCQALSKIGGSLVSIVPGSTEAQADAQVAGVASRLQDAGLRQGARFLTGNPLERLAALTGPVDLLFLSGEIDYAAALEAAMPRLRPGSIVVAHHALHDKAFLAAVLADPSFETTVHDHGAGLSVSLRTC